MKLLEFFGTAAQISDKPSTDDLTGKTEVDREKQADDIFWFMLDDDSLHKKYFIPLAREVVEQIKANKFNAKQFNPKWMPMVNQACIRFYNKEEMTGDPKDEFPFEFRKGLCIRFGEHVYDDIKKGEYNLGI